MGKDSMKPKMLTKIKVVTVTTQNVPVNVNNFLCMRQKKAKSVQLYLGHLMCAARHSNFNLLMGQPSYRYKVVIHTLVQRLEDPTIAKDVIEEYATNSSLQNRPTLKKHTTHLGQI